ncbi:uncharacterized protein [Temnothorax longispinosus]|uniref:uncharacterized protein isoform X1 n=1 Tax=Temnothorax longispinosus TaxID=300112 RepID=UPI003A99A87C
MKLYNLRNPPFQFLACVAALCTAQIQDGPRGAPIPIRATRYQRLPPRPGGTGPAAAFPNQRFRRPISFKPRGGLGDDAPGTFRPLRPNLPVSAPSFAHHVKPVNEEPEDEENLSRDSTREDEDSRDQSQEARSQDSEEDLSEEVPRAAPNPPRVIPVAPGPQVYRPLHTVTPASVRVSPATPPPPPPIQYRPTPPPPPPPIQYRPTQKPTKAPRKQIIDDITFQQPIKPPKPVKPSQAYEIRGKKPVAQIIRRYRHDNADGSITWGFENDDGSYKEETIGQDCITSGKYGYIDPDGLRREYTYETGIKCDEQQREDEEDGFVDYQENKLVLPDGKTIDLSSMGKKQARRPQFQYRN